jgi:hypothetical protein
MNINITINPAPSADVTAVAAALSALGDAMRATEWGRADGAAVRAAADSMGGLDAVRAVDISLALSAKRARGIEAGSAACDAYCAAFCAALR